MDMFSDQTTRLVLIADGIFAKIGYCTKIKVEAEENAIYIHQYRIDTDENVERVIEFDSFDKFRCEGLEEDGYLLSLVQEIVDALPEIA